MSFIKQRNANGIEDVLCKNCTIQKIQQNVKYKKKVFSSKKLK